jgi:hypothetical protein
MSSCLQAAKAITRAWSRLRSGGWSTGGAHGRTSLMPDEPSNDELWRHLLTEADSPRPPSVVGTGAIRGARAASSASCRWAAPSRRSYPW